METPPPGRGPVVDALRAILLLVWAGVSFGVCFFARDLQFYVAGWPLNYWVAAQGGILVYLGVVVLYAFVLKRADTSEPDEEDHD